MQGDSFGETTTREVVDPDPADKQDPDPARNSFRKKFEIEIF